MRLQSIQFDSNELLSWNEPHLVQHCISKQYWLRSFNDGCRFSHAFLNWCKFKLFCILWSIVLLCLGTNRWWEYGWCLKNPHSWLWLTKSPSWTQSLHQCSWEHPSWFHYRSSNFLDNECWRCCPLHVTSSCQSLEQRQDICLHRVYGTIVVELPTFPYI